MTAARPFAADAPLDVAPLDWSELSPEQADELRGILDDVQNGRVDLVPHSVVQAELRARAARGE